MADTTIKNYSFKPSSIGIEVKNLDFLWEKDGGTARVHRTDFYHFIWVEEGELLMTIDFEPLTLRRDDAFLIAPGQVCLFDLSSRPQAYSILFVPEFLGEATTDARLLRRVIGANPLKKRIIPLQGLPISEVIRQLICELTNAPDEFQNIVVRSCLRILLAEVARRIPHGTMDTPCLAERFLDEVERQFHRLCNVGDYAKLLSTGEKPLAAAIRQATGLTPKTYIDRRRVLEAKRLLVYSKRSVKEIGFALGFDEPTNFNKFFRKHCGISPNDFRQTLGKG